MAAGRVIRVLATLAIIALLAIFAMKVDWATTRSAFSRAEALPLFLAVVANLLSFAVKGVRWWIFLRPIGIPSFWLAQQGTFIGAAINNALIANAGEGARVIFVARETKVHAGPVLASVAMERFFDVMGYVIMLVVALYAFPVPRTLEVLRPWAPVALAAMVIILLVLFRQHSTHSDEKLPTVTASRRWVASVKRFLVEFGVSLRQISTPGRFAGALLLSLVAWALLVATYALGAEALGSPLSLAGNVAVTIAVSVGFAVRFTPGNVGVFQVAYSVTAAFFGVDRDEAVAVALLIQAIQIVPVTVLGFALSPKFVLGGSRDGSRGPGVVADPEKAAS
jgi:glycosyltransferase 2 family protein